MFLGGGIYSINENRQETYQTNLFNGLNNTYSLKKTERHVHFAVCLFVFCANVFLKDKNNHLVFVLLTSKKM